MLLTQCPVCAAALPARTAKQCSRCKTRYCGPACQKQHWEEGGHDTLCKKIKRGGGAEQYHADKKFTEAVTASLYFLSAWYFSAPPPRLILRHSPSWPPSSQCFFWQAAPQ